MFVVLETAKFATIALFVNSLLERRMDRLV